MAILVYVMRRWPSEEKTFPEFQEQVSHVNTWEHGVPGDFPLDGAEAEASLECLRHQMKALSSGK